MTLEPDQLRQAILEALSGHTVASLATQDDAGPHAVSLLYTHTEFDLYWLSDPNTRHSRHLAHNGRCSVSIARQHDDFRTIMGLQMRGCANRLDPGADTDSGFTLLTACYPFLREFTAGDLARHLGKAAVYRFRPDRITLIDNTRGFGYRQVLEL